jgi:ThiF family
MVNREELFARVPDNIDVGLLNDKRVVIVGVGMVGSPVAYQLAWSAVGHLRLIDHDCLKIENLMRHVLPKCYLRWNKAEAMAHYLADQIDGLSVDAVPLEIRAKVTDNELDALLADADLIIAATDSRTAQRRVMQSALALDIPALAPALYVPHGGELIVQGNWDLPCFGCWDYFRENDEQLRGARMLGFTAFPVIHATLDCSLGLLDPSSGHGEIMTEPGSQVPNQIFTFDRLGTLDRAPGARRHDCPSCGGGPSSAAEFERTSFPLPHRGMLVGFIVAVAVMLAIVASVGSNDFPQSSTEHVSTSNSSGTEATQAPRSAAGSPPRSPSRPARVEEAGTSVATAQTVEPGIEETGNSGTVAYGEGSCGPEEGQFWKATLTQGEMATIVWGGSGGSAMGLDIWPPGIGEVHGSGEGRLTYQSTKGEHTEDNFTAPVTGVYTIVIDDSCGAPGMFHFILRVGTD